MRRQVTQVTIVCIPLEHLALAHALQCEQIACLLVSHKMYYAKLTCAEGPHRQHVEKFNKRSSGMHTLSISSSSLLIRSVRMSFNGASSEKEKNK